MQSPVALLKKYGNTGVVIDSNLLLLLFLCSFDQNQIRTNKKLAEYSKEDFELLVNLLGQVQVIVTTPNILTEVSNLSIAIPEKLRAAYFAHFARSLTILKEETVPSASALNGRWTKFGLTDAAIAAIANQKYLVITDDFRLSQSLQSDGIDALNFNHLRQAYWRMPN